MSETQFSDQPLSKAEHEEMMAALFAQLVMQQANMAMMLLGKVPHPQTGKTFRDLEGARLFIDQLEMLEAKTRGNLNKDEETLLKQSLMSLRLAFVEAVEKPPQSAPAGGTAPAEKPAAEPSTPPVKEASAPSADLGSPSDAESKKKFSKKY